MCVATPTAAGDSQSATTGSANSTTTAPRGSAEAEQRIVQSHFESDTKVLESNWSKVWVDSLATASVYNAIAGENSTSQESKDFIETVSVGI